MAGWWNHPAYRQIIMSVPDWRKKKLLEEANQRQAPFGSNLQPSQAWHKRLAGTGRRRTGGGGRRAFRRF